MFPTTTLNAHYSTVFKSNKQCRHVNNLFTLTGFPSKKFGFNFRYTIQMMGQLTIKKCTNLPKNTPFQQFRKILKHWALSTHIPLSLAG